MTSTIDFSTMNDDELLFGFQRVNRARFPQHFIACTEEIAKRGLQAPEKFEIECLTARTIMGAFQKLSGGLSSLTQIFSRRSPASDV